LQKGKRKEKTHVSKHMHARLNACTHVHIANTNKHTREKGREIQH